ncbi:MAG: AraC family transcriptional regulator [Clostridia bacterium]|nr:AraC family transcriptional regulator [Clostridia bacterium]
MGLSCGIGDVYYFSRVFKKVEGVSVREYRKQWCG